MREEEKRKEKERGKKKGQNDIIEDMEESFKQLEPDREILISPWIISLEN